VEINRLMQPLQPLEWEPTKRGYQAWQEIHARLHAQQTIAFASTVTVNSINTIVRNNALPMLNLDEGGSDELTIIYQTPPAAANVSTLSMLNLDDGGQEEWPIVYPTQIVLTPSISATPVLSLEDGFSDELTIIYQPLTITATVTALPMLNLDEGGPEDQLIAFRTTSWAEAVTFGNSVATGPLTVTGAIASSGNITITNTNAAPSLFFRDGSGNNYTIARDVATGFLIFTGTQASFSGFRFVDATGTVATIANGGAVQLPASPLVSTTTQSFTGLANKKTADTTSGNATLTADAALTVTCNETGYYKVEVFLSFYEATLGTGGFQFDLNAGSATVGGILLGLDGFSTAALTNAAITSITTVTAATSIATASSAPSWYFATGSMQITATGTFGVRWAQNTISANVTTLKALSYIVLTKIG
jgi:hypothetical protein